MRTTWLPAILALALTACDSTVSPPEARPLVGTFALISVGGEPLPYVSTSSSMFIRQETRLLADTLVFASDGTGRGLQTAIIRDLNTNSETPAPAVRTFVHARDGDHVVLDSLECGPVCRSSIRQTRYTLRDDGLEQLGLSGGVARYERISP